MELFDTSGDILNLHLWRTGKLRSPRIQRATIAMIHRGVCFTAKGLPTQVGPCTVPAIAGITYCSVKDEDADARGAVVAIQHALEGLSLRREDREHLWEGYFKKVGIPRRVKRSEENGVAERRRFSEAVRMLSRNILSRRGR